LLNRYRLRRGGDQVATVSGQHGSRGPRGPYAKTPARRREIVDAALSAFAEHWDEAVEDAGLARAKVWMLYMAGSRLGFEQRKIELHQVLGVNVAPGGDAGMPLRPTWGS
jgi:hypothetical protein